MSPGAPDHAAAITAPGSGIALRVANERALMFKQRLVMTVAALVAAGAVTTPAFASGGGGGNGGGGGGGGGGNVVLPEPAIPPGTFEGIGSGPVYVHESFGHAQRTRYTQAGKVIDAVDKAGDQRHPRGVPEQPRRELARHRLVRRPELEALGRRPG